MSYPPVTLRSFELLRELKRNNERAWFQAHKAEYEIECREAFEGVLVACSEALADGPLPLTGGKASMFRPYRDVRFSKDKSPYKTNVTGLLTRNGTKTMPQPGGVWGMIYLNMEPDVGDGGGFIGSGHYKLSPKALAPMRQRMVEEPKRFHKVLDQLNDHGLSLSMEDSLSSMPRGFSDYADHELADYIKLKTLITQENMTEIDWISGRIVERVVNMGKAVGSLVDFRV